MSSPLVSIVTPVYNGAPYLRECIDSVLAQTYSSWEYTIVNNCSTDDTLAIADEYAKRDARIHIHNNSSHVRVIENHNIAVRAISPQSKYCKLILADDWMFPNCLKSMVLLAEKHPMVGVVGAYGLCGTRVAWQGLPYPSTVVPGRSICRASLLGELSVFGSPTTTMFRADLVRGRDPFYNESNFHADLEVCYETLKHSDFGFAHELLTFTRVDNESLRSTARRLNSYLVGYIHDVLKFGPDYLSESEYKQRLGLLWDEYYEFLARAVFPKREPAFWSYHKQKLQSMGQKFSRLKLLKAVIARGVDATLNPKRSLEGVWDLCCRATPGKLARVGAAGRMHPVQADLKIP